MVTTWKGRGALSSRPTQGGYSFFSTQPAGSEWGGKGSVTKRGTKKAKRKEMSAGTPAGYKTVCASLERKLDSFKTLYNQTKGVAKCARPTPAVLNSFTNWINKGAVVQTVKMAQIAQWARLANKTFNTRNPTPTACKNVLCSKFGKTTIKAVARTKSGQFMVATASSWRGKPFCFSY